MIVISDTSCIGYLIMIEKLFLLEQNFLKVIIPSAVHKEIIQLAPTYDLTIYSQSQWITIAEVNDRNLYNHLLNQRGKGESEAIALYKEANADLLLIDERKGTIIARSLGIKTIGLLGVLLLSIRRKFILNVRSVLDELITTTTFRTVKNLYSNVLKEANEL